MRKTTWLKKHTESLAGKTVAVTGTTGGLGRELCRELAALGASLILLDRNEERSSAFAQELKAEFPTLSVRRVRVDLSDVTSVWQAIEILRSMTPDLFIHNAGAYSIPRKTCSTGYDNVFQINFVSPYLMIRELLPMLRERGGRVVVVGSIAHTYSKIDPEDMDFSTRKKASLVYGNAKRHLMCAIMELAEKEKDVDFCVTHPGITFTNITAHYPKVIFALIKHPMKIIFMKPKKACLSILAGVFAKESEDTWIGPWLFDVWGMPKAKRLTTVKKEEREEIGARAEAIYERLCKEKKE